VIQKRRVPFSNKQEIPLPIKTSFLCKILKDKRKLMEEYIIFKSGFSSQLLLKAAFGCIFLSFFEFRPF